MSGNDFAASRLGLARARRRMTLTELADLVGSSATRISQFQSGKETPGGEMVSALARALRFPEEFFYQPALEPVDKDAVSFRSLSRLRARDRDAALASASVARLLSRWMEKHYELPMAAIPEMSDASPEHAAEAVRSLWGLGQGPVLDMVQLLEAHGVRVFSLLEDCNEMDAFCMWDGDVPFVFLNTIKSGERSRFDAAHELGHLVLHRKERLSRNQDAEREANDFASAFLMPRHATMAAVHGPISLATALALKKQWGVSVSAAAVRLFRLGLLSDWNYRLIFQQLGARGWRTKEPDPRQHERSQLLKIILDDLDRMGSSIKVLADELAVPVAELRLLTFGLAEVPLALRTGLKAPDSPHPDLRLVR